MKSIFVLAILFSVNAQAAVCGLWVDCGVYQALDSRITDREVIRELVVEEGTEADHLKVEFATIDRGVRTVQSTGSFTFTVEGAFSVLSKSGAIRANGFCAYKACTFSPSPRMIDNKLFQEAATFRFLGDSVLFHKFVVDGDGKAVNSEVKFLKK